MRKNFLLLLLLALLPLAGWAQGNLPEAREGLGADASHEVEMITAPGSNWAHWAFAVTNSATRPAWGDATIVLDGALPKASAPGTYYVHYALRQSAAVNADRWNNYTASGSEQNGGMFTVVVKKYPNLSTVPSLQPGLVFKGSAQDLINGDPVYPVDYSTTTGGIEYIVATTATVPDYAETGADVAQQTPAGTYYVYYRVKTDNDEYGNGQWTQVGSSGVKIAKANITDIADWSAFITAPAAVTDELTYNGSAQNLITPAVILDAAAFNNATITYSVDGGAYGATYTATDALDPHTVTYQITGADNFNDFTSAAIEKPIKKFTPVLANTPGVYTDVVYQKGTAQDLIATAPAYSGPNNVNVPGTFTFAWTDGTAKTANDPGDVEATNVAEYPITYTFVPTDATNYESIATDQTLGTATIIPADYVFDAAPAKTAAELTYNGADQKLLAQGFTLKATEDLGTPEFTWYRKADKSDAQTTDDWEKVVGLHAGTYTVEWTFTADAPNTDNWNVASGKIENIEMKKVGLVISGATIGADYDPAASYDKADLFVYDDEAFVAADKAKAVDIVTSLVNFKLTKGSDEITVFPTTDPVNAGVWTIELTKITDADVEDYNIKNLQPGQLTVKKVDPTTATVAPTFADLIFDNTDQLLATAGTSDPSEGKWMYRLEGAATEDVPTGKNVGEYTVYYKFVGDENHNDIAEASQVVKIEKATPGLSLSIIGWTYGEAANDPTTGVNFAADDEPTITYAVQGTTTWGTYDEIVNDQAGKYTVKASVAEADNWEAEEVTADFEIAQAALTLKVKDATKVYGAADPTFELDSPAYVNGDDDTKIGLTFTRATGETVGDYTITPAATSTNYAYTIEPGTLTITAAELAIEIDDQTKVYGDEDPDFTAAFKGLTNGDEPDDIALSYSREAGQDVGEYEISATATGAAAGNYTITFTTGTLTITKAALTLTAKADSKVYGEADPEFVLATEPAYKNGDDATAIGLTITREEGENVGTYTITPAATSKNYEYTIEPADFEITPASLVYTLTNAEYTYTGEAINPVEGETFVKTDGKFFFDDAYGKTFTFAWPDEAEVKDAGTYNFIKLETVWAEGENENYYVVFSKDATITVAPAEITVTAPVAAEGLIFSGEDQELIATAGEAKFGEDAFAFEYTLGELKSDKAAEIVATDADTYEIAWKVVDETGNFTFVDAEGESAAEGTIEATIAPAEWTLTVAEIAALQAEDIVYDGTDKFNLDLENLTVKNGEIALTADDYDLAVTFKKNAEAAAAPATKFFNAGIYTFTFTGKGNYADEDNVEALDVEILKADFTVKAPVAATGLEYEKKDLTLIATPAEATVAKTDAFEPVVLYSLSGEEESYDAALPTAMNAGDYDVYYMVEGDDNHNDFVAAEPVTVNIAKAELIATAANAKKTYDGTTDIENDEFGDFSYSGLLGGDHVDLGDAQISDFVKLTLGEKENGIDVGTYTLTIEDVDAFPEQLNYYVGSALPGTLTIDPAKEVTIAFTAAAKYGKEYAAKDNLEVVAGDLMASPAAGWFDDFADIADQLTISREEGEDVGTYDVMLALGEKATFQNNYENVIFAVGADKFEITPFATELKVSIASASRNYNGEDAAYTWAEDYSNMVVTNLPEGKEKSEIFTKLPEVKVVAAGKNVGEYNVELTGGESKNYTFKLLPGSYYTIEPVAVKAVFNSIPVAAVGLLGEDVLAQVDWAVEAVDEEDAATLEANKGLFELIFADGVLDANKKIAEGETGEAALVINYKGEEDPANFAFDGDNTADLNIGGEGEDIALDDSGEIITYASEGSNVTFTQSRKVKTNVWQAAVLPFDATPAQISDAFGYAAVDLFDQSRTNATEVHFSLNVSETVKAGTPFLFKTDNEVDFNTVTFENVNLVNTEGLNTTVKDDDTDIEFIGTFKKIGVWGEQFRYLSGGTWYNAGKYTEAKPANIKPLRAYLNMGSNAGARIIIEEPDGTTSIMDVRSFNEDMTAEGWYTIDGKKLNAAPTQKGVYIQNGQKVVIK